VIAVAVVSIRILQTDLAIQSQRDDRLSPRT
jgi:hypothetical protein